MAVALLSVVVVSCSATSDPTTTTAITTTTEPSKYDVPIPDAVSKWVSGILHGRDEEVAVTGIAVVHGRSTLDIGHTVYENAGTV